MGGGRRSSAELEFSSSSDASSTDESVLSGDPPPCESCVAAGDGRTCSIRLDAKDFIRRYKPGDLIGEIGGTRKEDYEIPEMTTLLLIGPRGSGKSSLINKITKLFDHDPFAPDRAQISHNLSVTAGSCFLQEYTIPRDSKSICLYDTRSLSKFREDDFKMIKKWMTEGVSHGEMVIWDSDDEIKISEIKSMGREGQFCPCKRRPVNFVIFVIDALSILKLIETHNGEYTDLLVETFNYPFLSYKDNKPVVAVTHGEELSFVEQTHINSYIGDLLGIPLTQIYNIPGTDDDQTELAILCMLRHCIELADRNLPYKPRSLTEREGKELYGRMMNRLFGYDSFIEILIICICIGILLLRAMEMFFIK